MSAAVKSVAGKTVLITGAAMGMGKLYARYAVEEHARAVILWDVNGAELDKTAADLRAVCASASAGVVVHPFVVDVSKFADIQAAAERVRAEVGAVEILMNNAGIVCSKYFWDHHIESDISQTMAINALAPMYVTREFLPAMIRSADKVCRIVNVASAAGLLSNPGMSVYCASKWSVVGWSDSLRLELAKAGIRHVRVTTVCPSYVSTGMFEGAKAPLLTPFLTPEYVTRRVWSAMKTGKALLTMPWTVRMSMLARGLLPVSWWDFVAGRIFGVYNSMDERVGRPSRQ